jgi:flagellar basal body-associated protein FliL
MSDNYYQRPPKPRKRKSGVQIIGLSILAAAVVLAAAGGIFAALSGSGKAKPTPIQTTGSLALYVNSIPTLALVVD